MNFFTKKKTNYGKIVAITLACVAAASAVAYVVYALLKKYREETIYDDLLEDCDCECDCECDCDCEEEEALEEAVADAE